MDKKFFFQIVGLLIIIFGGTILAFNQDLIPALGNKTAFPSPAGNVQNVVQLLDTSTQQVKSQVRVDIADTKEKRSLGLGGRASLAGDSGMLFIMDQKNKPTFWMKGMLIPLDFLWIDGDKVADIIQNVQPPVEGQSDQTLQFYSPLVPVDKVLEVNAGFVAHFGIKVGDTIRVVQAAPTQ